MSTTRARSSAGAEAARTAIAAPAPAATSTQRDATAQDGTVPAPDPRRAADAAPPDTSPAAAASRRQAVPSTAVGMASAKAYQPAAVTGARTGTRKTTLVATATMAHHPTARHGPLEAVATAAAHQPSATTRTAIAPASNQFSRSGMSLRPQDRADVQRSGVATRPGGEQVGDEQNRRDDEGEYHQGNRRDVLQGRVVGDHLPQHPAERDAQRDAHDQTDRGEHRGLHDHDQPRLPAGHAQGAQDRDVVPPAADGRGEGVTHRPHGQQHEEPGEEHREDPH